MTPPSVAVFGSSEARPGDPLYEDARAVGRGLARDGYRVVTGGYAGVMEAASRGAREAGGPTLGVLTTIFRDRRPNRFLTQILTTADLPERMRALVTVSGAYVVLWGRSGTLAEVALVWALQRSGSLGPRPVVLLGDRWERLLLVLQEAGMLDGRDLRSTRWVLAPEAVPAVVGELLSSRGGG